MKTEKAIKYFKDEVRFCERAPAGNIAHMTTDWVQVMEANRAALAALREKQERGNPKPLTLDELRGMIGEWVWVVVSYEHDATPFQCEGWAFVSTPTVIAYLEQMIPTDFCGHKFTAYRYKPEEVQNDG